MSDRRASVNRVATVFIVTSGVWDSYKIERVFADRESAHAYANQFDPQRTHREYRVEEWGVE